MTTPSLTTNASAATAQIKVAVIETDVYGVKAYHTRCLNCGKETKRKNTMTQATKDAQAQLPPGISFSCMDKADALIARATTQKAK